MYILLPGNQHPQSSWKKCQGQLPYEWLCFEHWTAAQEMPIRVSPAKIACLDFNLKNTKMQLGVQVVVTDPRELEKIHHC